VIEVMKVFQRAFRGLARRVGLGAKGPPGGRAEGADWYDALYASTAEYHGRYEQSFYYFLWAVIVDRVRRAGLRRVLEVGCGPGQLAAFLLEQGVEHYVGVDFSPRAVELARANAPAGTFLVGDARDPAPHAEVEHDAVVCTEVLEHLEDDLGVVALFRPGKRCLCSVPNFPYDGHVRHFQDARAVAERYGPFFDGLDVMTLKSPRDPLDRFFLFDGVRNAHGAGEAVALRPTEGRP
jgi:SAM-dependent methyltransferase